MPYKDETLTTTFTADGTSNAFELDFVPGAGGVNEFEVFVAGRRLRKTAISSYKFESKDNAGVITSSTAQDSPEGDITLPAEFSLSGNTLTITVNDPETELKER